MRYPFNSKAGIAIVFALSVVLCVFIYVARRGEPVPQQRSAAAPAVLPDTGGARGRKVKPGENFDSRPIDEKKLRETLDSRAEAVRRLAALVPGAGVDFDEKLGTPKFVASNERFLTGARGTGGAVSAARAAEYANLPHAEVRAFIAEFADLFGHGPEVLDAAEVKRDYTTGHNGLRTTVWQQQLDGIRVFESVLMAHVTERGELVNVASTLVPDARAGENSKVQGILAKPPVDVRKAIRVAAATVGDVVPESRIVAADVAIGQSKRQKFRAPAVLELSAEYVWLPLDADRLRLCWEVIHVSKKRGEMFQTLVDAQTGEAVLQHGLTAYISPASYRVFTSDSPTPMSPGHPNPTTAQPAEVARSLVTLDALNTTASPNGWINDGGNETVGNNVDAHLDLNADNVADTPRPQGSPSRVFDRPFDSTQAPTSYRDASVVNLFYWNNVIHDRFYELGFTEAAGNFQTNNFGRGGTGNDAVQADSQDGSGTNNANFSTPADGSPGRMQMFIFTGPTPDRDSSFDAEIIIHEYTHGLSNRLVGGGVGLSALQSTGMGEGWSDFYALGLLSEAGDNVNGQFAKGGYSTREITAGFPNYYYGIRRYPYSTDMSKSPLTFKDIDPGQASPHTGVPLSPRYASSNANPSQVHAQGEVWCNILREVWVNLVNAHGHATGNTLALRLVTDGMKLAPANPNFVQARDAILQAELVFSAGANRGHLWNGFAKRGLGSGATSPASSTTTGVVESYSIPDVLAVSPLATWSPVGVAGGPFTPATNTFTLTNSGSSAIDWTVSSNQPWVTLTSTVGTLAGGANSTITAGLASSAGLLPAGTHSAQITFTNVTTGIAQARQISLTVEPFAIPIFDEDWESGTARSMWTITGTNSHRTLITSANAPRGGNWHLTMDSPVDGTYARNEATLSLDLSGRQNVVLKFHAKMFSDEPDGPPATPFTNGADFDGVAISANGTTWYEVQPLRTLVSVWTAYTVDISAAAATYGLPLGPGFKIRFNHYDNYGISTDGFAFDDIRVFESVNRQLLLSGPPVVAENAAPVSITLSVSPTQATDTTVALSSSVPGRLSVPASVTIPAGQPSVVFLATPLDDALLNGGCAVTLSALTPGFAMSPATVRIADSETTMLTLTLPASGAEGASLTGTVTAGSAVDGDVQVALTSSAPADLQVPATVTIPAGQNSVNFTAVAVNDSRIDGTVSVTTTAHVDGWTDGSTVVALLDDEPTTLSITLPVMREGDTGRTGTVSIAGTLTTPLVVSLASSDVTALGVPETATIAAGATAATFPLTIVNDTVTDGAQNVTVTATAPGFTDGVASGAVADNDVHSFSVSAVGSPKTPNVSFPLVVTARDVTGAVITNFNSAVALGAAGDGGPVGTSPAVLSTWANGTWSGNVAVLVAATNVILTVSDGNGHVATSNAFDVVTGPLHHFGFSVIPSPQFSDTPIAVTLTAQDAANNTVTAFNGTVALTCLAPAPSTLNLPVTPAASGTFSNGMWSGSLVVPFAMTGLRLQADDGAGHTGTSAVFNVSTATAQLPSTTVFSEDFESGVFGSWWTITGTNSHRTQITSSYGPRSGTRHMTMDSSSDTVYSRNEATLTVDLTGRTGVILRYWIAGFNDEYNGPPTRPFTNGADFDGVAISANGTTWYEVQPISAPQAAYSEKTVDLDAAVAAAGLSYNSTFKIRFNHYDDYTITTDGFGIDDIVITAAAPPPQVVLSIPTQVTEGSGIQAGTVSLPAALGADKVFALQSGAPAKIMVPASVTIPAGQTSANFDFTVLDDAFLDGAKQVFISVKAPGESAAYSTTTVLDNDVTTITLSLSAATATEGDAALVGTVTLGAPPAVAITFDIAATPSGQVTVPATVTMAVGETTKTFSVAIVNDSVIDGSQSVALTVGAAGWNTAAAGLTVLDNESTNLTLTVPSALREGLPSQSGTVTLGGTVPANLTVTLASSDTTELTVPASVTIPAGQSSVAFPITIIDDTEFDGPQTATITASAPGFSDATAASVIQDNEIHRFSFAPIGTPQIAGGPVPVIITARDITDAVVTSYTGGVSLTAAGAGGPLVVTPSQITGFANGARTAFVQLTGSDTGVQIVATNPDGRTGISNAFDLVAGVVAGFAWDAVPSPQVADNPFSVRIRAVDGGGNTATSFNGAASLGVLVPIPGSTIGSGSTSNYNTFNSYYHDLRSNTLYTAAEIGSAGRLLGIAYNFTSVSGLDTLTNLTIRLKHTSAASLTTGGWDNNGWTQVYRGSPALTVSGWMTFNFSTPFDYDGTRNLLVDISFDRTVSNFTSTAVQGTSSPDTRTIYSTSSNGNGDPLTWTTAPVQTATSGRADIRLVRYLEMPIRPSMTGNFVDGVWQGKVSVPFAATGLALRASAGMLTQASNTFDVGAGPTGPSGNSTVFSEDFESGTLNPAYWTITGTGNFRTINSSLDSPRAGLRHMTMDEATGSGTYARNEATLTVNLAGRTGVQLEFWAKGFSEEADGPPPSPFPSTGANFDGVAISADGGVNWYEIQPLRSLTGSYVKYSVDLDAALAARSLAYGPNFKIRVNQYDNFNIPTDGIAIDDIVISAAFTPAVTIGLPTQLIEGGVGVSGTLTLAVPAEADTIITLSSTVAAKLSVPDTVLIPIGQTTATFPLALPDDSLLDGLRTVSVSAVVPGFLPSTKTITVLDDETGVLSITAPATAQEGSAALTGTITISPMYSGPVFVNLASSDTTEATVPAGVTVPLGVTTATFPITVVNDSEIDGPQTPTITASVAGLSSGSAQITVTDNETRTLGLSGAGTVYEGQIITGSVFLQGTLPAPLVVSLSSSNPSQLTVPATVTIPAGATSASYTITPVDDSAMDGAVSVTITATAATFTSATLSVSVYDNDVHHFTFASVPSPQVRGRPFSTTVYARDVNNSTITVFNGTVNLSAASGAAPLAMTPAVTPAFSSGQWTGNVTISTNAAAAVITAGGTGGVTGASNSFTVGTGPIAGFVWGAVPSPQNSQIPFAATLSAQDGYGNTVTTFNGTANVAAGPAQRTVGGTTSTSNTIFPVSQGNGSRSQMIYLASEIGAAGRISGIAFNMLTAPTTVARFTIRMKHTTLTSYSTYAWETTGWTTVFQSDVTPVAAGLLQLNFSTPFDYDGTSNLMIDCSFFAGSASGTSGTVSGATMTTARQLYYYTSASTDPLTWGSTNSVIGSTFLPNLKVRVDRNLPVQPTTVTLSNGLWSGNLSVGTAAAAATLTADSGSGLTGESNPFSVAASPAIVVTPAGMLTTTGDVGGPFAPGSHTFTISNPGALPVNWTASTSFPWIALSATSGTITANGNTSVVATLSPALLAAFPSGNTDGVVTFTNATNGLGNTSRTIRVSASPHGTLSVTATGGGNYQLSNTGDLPLNWTAAADGLLTVTTQSGSLGVGASTIVGTQFSSATSLLRPGRYLNSLIFTNTSTGHGNTTLSVPYDVFSPVPQLAPEPPATGGTANTINWTVSGSPAVYQVERAGTVAFASASTVDSVSALSHTFSGLAEGPYFYRVRTRDHLRDTKAWLQVTPATLASGAKINVEPFGNGIGLVASTGNMAGRLTNPGFDSGGTGTVVAIPGWTKAGVTSGQRDVGVYGSLAALAPLPTSAPQQLVFFTYASTQSAGDYCEVTQSFDFTDLRWLRFDHSNAPGTGSAWSTAMSAQVLVDNTVVWSSNAAGVNLNQAADISGYTGTHILRLRMRNGVTGAVPSVLVAFDNLRLESAVGYASSGSITSTDIQRTLGGWGQLIYNTNVPAGTALTVDVLDSTGAFVAAAVPSGTELGTIPAIASKSTIRLRANFTTTSSSATPLLHNWIVTSVEAPPTEPAYGPWSNIVSSVQDATGPVIQRTSPLTAYSANYAAAGAALDSAGVQSLNVNGVAVNSTNGFASWTAAPVTLSTGANIITITASDSAVPPNTTTEIWSVVFHDYVTDSDGDRLPDSWEIANGFNPADAASPQGGPTGDADGDGCNNMLEFALGLDPNKPDGPGQSVTIEVNPADGLRYPVYQYRRRMGLSGWSFDVLGAASPANWTPASGEMVSDPVPDPDGITETVRLRVNPAVTGVGGRFFRLRVAAP